MTRAMESSDQLDAESETEMTNTEADQLEESKAKGPRFFVVIEGREYPWSEEAITTEQIAQLGGFDASAGVIEVDKDNNERTLRPGEIVSLKPGHGFGKKHRFKRG